MYIFPFFTFCNFVIFVILVAFGNPALRFWNPKAIRTSAENLECESHPRKRRSLAGGGRHNFVPLPLRTEIVLASY